jgi:hypothetical protein
MRRNLAGIDRQDVEALNALGAGGGPATPTIHLTLQGKGGVGKTLVSSILAQYFRPRGALASRLSSRTSERCEAFSWRSPSRRSVVSVSQLRFYRDCTRSRWQLPLHDASAGQPAALPWRRKDKTVSSRTSTLIEINEIETIEHPQGDDLRLGLDTPHTLRQSRALPALRPRRCDPIADGLPKNGGS